MFDRSTIIIALLLLVFVCAWSAKLLLVKTDRDGGFWRRSEILADGQRDGSWFPIGALVGAVVCVVTAWGGLHDPEQAGAIGAVVAIVSLAAALLCLLGRAPDGPA
jgi:hypothetical protein